MPPLSLTRPPARPGRAPWLLAFALASLFLAGCGTLGGQAPVTPPPATPPVTPESQIIVETAPPTPDTVAPPAVPVPLRLPRIGLALGGGAARGFAHIGVIQVLEEAGIRPNLVVGTSAGSLVAALYASGKNGSELAQLADTMDESAFADWSFPLRGVIRGEALARYVRQNTGGRNIEQMKMPLGIVATDLSNGQGILFQNGDTGLAVRASSSVPAVFQPVLILGREYVDGGLVAPVPVRYARQNTGGRNIEQMKMPLGIVATDLSNGQGILFQNGDTGVAVRASSSVPAVFQPVLILGREYVDGGLVAPVPVRYARQMGADLVIAVDISAAVEGGVTSDVMSMLLHTFSIMGRSINTFELREADVVLRPKLNNVGSADFAARKRSIAAGRQAMQALMPELKAKLAAKSR